jgi:hypothetical protein
VRLATGGGAESQENPRKTRKGPRQAHRGPDRPRWAHRGPQRPR